MSAVKKMSPNPEGYSPKTKPAIMSLAEEAGRNVSKELVVEQINECCSIVDRAETLLIGVGLTLTYESRGYNYGGFESWGHDLTDFSFAKKVIKGGEVALLAKAAGVSLDEKEIMSARYDIKGDGNHSVLVGFEVDSFEHLPAHLPEYTVKLTVPSCRFAKMLINEEKAEGRIGYEERMHADEFFVGGFRQETKYVYNQASQPMNTYDNKGNVLAKYEPVKLPHNDEERYDSLKYKLVILPEMKIACSMTPPDSEDFVITKYFGVEHEVFATPAAQYYLHDYYGFPVDSAEGGQPNSCFGTRVSDFDGLPDSVEKVSLPGGIYVHITQLEFNGDNPSIPYDVAFNHLDELFLSAHPSYARDWSRHVIARFRQQNSASVFVPLTYEGK